VYELAALRSPILACLQQLRAPPRKVGGEGSQTCIGIRAHQRPETVKAANKEILRLTRFDTPVLRSRICEREKLVGGHVPHRPQRNVRAASL